MRKIPATCCSCSLIVPLLFSFSPHPVLTCSHLALIQLTPCILMFWTYLPLLTSCLTSVLSSSPCDLLLICSSSPLILLLSCSCDSLFSSSLLVLFFPCSSCSPILLLSSYCPDVLLFSPVSPLVLLPPSCFSPDVQLLSFSCFAPILLYFPPHSPSLVSSRSLPVLLLLVSPPILLLFSS